MKSKLALLCLHMLLATGLYFCAPTTYIQVKPRVYKIEKEGCIDSTELANKATVLWTSGGILSDTVTKTSKPAYILVRGEERRLFSLNNRVYYISSFKPIDSPSWDRCYEYKRVKGLSLGHSL